MKKILALLLLSAAVTAHSQAQPFVHQQPMWCMAHNEVLKQLKEKYNETIIWIGKDIQDGSSYAMAANVKEDTWTFIKTNGEVACVMGVGNKGTFVGPNAI